MFSDRDRVPLKLENMTIILSQSNNVCIIIKIVPSRSCVELEIPNDLFIAVCLFAPMFPLFENPRVPMNSLGGEKKIRENPVRMGGGGRFVCVSEKKL